MNLCEWERERDHWPQEDSYALKKQKNYFEKYVCYQKWLISFVLPLVGFEKGLFKRMNEKRATETEAYLWSVSDMWLGSVWIKMMAICFLCVSGKDAKDSQHQLENMFHKLIGGSGVQLSFLYCSIAAAVSFAIEILYSWCLVVEFQLCRDAVTIQVIFVAWLRISTLCCCKET